MLKIPAELSEILAEAEKSINDNGELTAANRLRVHQVMENLLSKIHPNAGHYTRAKLAIACSYSSLHLIDVYPNEKQKAERVLKNSIDTLQGKYDSDVLESENEMLYTDSVNLMNEAKPFVPAVYGSFACNAAVNTVLYDSDFDSLGIDEKISAPEDWDASFYASIAHCGAAVWEGTGDNSKRKLFWLWYLNQAIPFAWDTDIPINEWPAVNWL
jgi:hypothetical protein